MTQPATEELIREVVAKTLEQNSNKWDKIVVASSLGNPTTVTVGDEEYTIIVKEANYSGSEDNMDGVWIIFYLETEPQTLWKVEGTYSSWDFETEWHNTYRKVVQKAVIEIRYVDALTE